MTSDPAALNLVLRTQADLEALRSSHGALLAALRNVMANAMTTPGEWIPAKFYRQAQEAIRDADRLTTMPMKEETAS
jgi:hypothetical protein